MGKRPQRRKHIPQRTCVACRTVRPKRDLVRIVRLPSSGAEDVVMVDETGKRSGRGAYLCYQRGCWEAALAQRQLERTLKIILTAETKAQLREYAAGLPQLLGTESEESGDAAKGVSTDE
ncbi:MAG: YlxR family protein [Chloroflexota bacterium]|nr:YlxR family protein [Chloroflexota bacterium]